MNKRIAKKITKDLVDHIFQDPNNWTLCPIWQYRRGYLISRAIFSRFNRSLSLKDLDNLGIYYKTTRIGSIGSRYIRNRLREPCLLDLFIHS